MTGAIGSDAQFWDRSARKYAVSPVADLAGYERTVARTRELLGPTARVLELGCGTGTTALKLAPSVGSLMATDVSAEMIAIAREKAAAAACSNVTFAQGTPASLGCGAASFDAVLAFNFLHLDRDLPATLAAMKRLLRPGGLFISKTPCLGDTTLPMRIALRLAVPVAQRIGKAPYVRFLTGETLKGEIARAGLSLVEEAKHGSKGGDFRPYLVARVRNVDA